MELPVLVTRAGISRVAESGGEATARSEAVRLVRRFGSEEALLRACYDGGRNTELGIATSTDPVSWLTGQGSLFANRDRFGRAARQAEASRDLYYRVTGTLFHAVPRPRAAMPLIPTPFNSRDRISQDEARGGTAVAGRIPGLSLAENRLDWHCEAASGLTWGEWTMTFDNRTGTAEEARCRIALPPEGFVSRVTLWVEGQPQEAAYSTVSQVRKAYQSVAVVQRRDPVLVTQPEEGSVLVQAFPVPAHGQLKTRITFTVPAGLDGRVWLPALTEQNFDLPADQTVPVWVQADRGMPELPQHWQGRAVEEGTAPTVTARMPVQDLAGNGSSFQWRPETAALVYAGDPFADANGAVVVREEKSPDVFAPRSVAWVIDTSAPLAGQADSIAAAVADLSGGAEGRVFLTGDRPDDVRALEGREILSASTFGEFQGGRDNTPVLAAAVDWLRGRPEACLIWIHGPQPAGFSDRTGLDQLLERSGSGFTLVDVPLVPGENALLAALSRPGRITLLPVRHAGPDLAGSLRSAFQRRRGEFRVIPRESLPPEAVQVGDSLVRWRARLEASRLAVTDPAAASAMAASHQVVSPWSGAVVLEKAEDYRANGLEQSDVKVSQQIPAVPEPSGVLLLLISAGHFLLRRRR